MLNNINRYLNKSFLLVDDFIEFRHSLKKMVETIGANNIDMAQTGQEALQLYSKSQHDFILLDFNLGEGINGLQMLEELNLKERLRHDTVIIMITAETSLDMVMGAIDVRPDEYLAKPFTKDTLKKRLDKAFAKKDAIRPIYRFLNNGNYIQAIKLCEQLIQGNHKYAVECHKIQADCFLRIGQPTKAQAVFEKMIQIRELGWALLGRARCKVHRSMYLEAIQDFDRIIETNRYSLEAYDQKAECLLMVGEYENAYRVLQQAVNISPNSAFRQRHLAALATRYHDYEVALSANRKVIALNKHLSQKQPDDYLKLAQLLSLVHGSNKGQLSRRAPQELAKLLKTMQIELQTNVQLAIATLLHQAIYDFMTNHQNDGQGKMAQVLQKINDLPDDLKPFLQDEITFAYRICPDEPQIIELFKEYHDSSADIDINKNSAKANSFNQQGINKFRDKEFETAYLAFKTAYLNARDNINITLNLMQAMVKLISKNIMPKDFAPLLTMFKQTYDQINSSDQRATHFRQLYNKIRSQISVKQNNSGLNNG